MSISILFPSNASSHGRAEDESQNENLAEAAGYEGMEVVAGEAGVSWDAEAFAEQEIRRLIQQVFFPGFPRPSRQVVVSSVDGDGKSAEVCVRIGWAMGKQLPGTVCVVEASGASGVREILNGNGGEELDGNDRGGTLRKKALRTGENLWLLTEAMFSGSGETLATAGLRGRLGELRREFDYTLIHAPAVTWNSATAVLGEAADGVILVLQAHSTRRAAAKSAQRALYAAQARLLGTVLNDRTFPVPDALYRRL